MTEPIVEQIAQWLLAALREITVAGGYHYTLSVSRPELLELPDKTIGDLTAILEQGEGEEAKKPTLTHRFRSQRFLVSVYLLGSAEPGVPVDQRLNRIAADIEQRLGLEVAEYPGSDRMCGGRAYSIEVGDIEIWIDAVRQATVLAVPVAIRFKTVITNPYAQA